MVCAKAARVSWTGVMRGSAAIDKGGVFEYGFGVVPTLGPKTAKKTTVPAGVTSNARGVAKLGDTQQHRVAIAIQRHLVHLLMVPRTFAFAPQTLTRAAVKDAAPSGYGFA